jgi:hypothetical protein
MPPAAAPALTAVRCATGIDAYIYVTADMSTSICQLGTATAGVVAYAMACDFDYDFNRPIQGGINICYSRCGAGRGRGRGLLWHRMAQPRYGPPELLVLLPC